MRYPFIRPGSLPTVATLAIAASLLGVPGAATAMPLGALSDTARTLPSPVDSVQWRGGPGGPRWGGPGWGGGPGWRGGPGWGGGPGWRGPGWGGPGWGGPGWRGGWGPGYPGWNRPVVVGPGWGWGPGWGGCGWGGCGWGPGAGFATGVIVGSAIAAPPPGVVYAAPPGSAVAYCMRRFKSYNPATGTYLGYDGRRHRCP